MIQSISNPFGVTIRPKPPTVGAPSWVPPVGFFADVPMTNMPQDVLPAIYRPTPNDTYAMTSPFTLWGGSAFLRDYSALGAQVYYSAGHEASVNQPNIQLSLICDFSTLTWSVANVPAQANPLSVFVNGYAPDGSAYCPHTYLGLQELPSAWGGGLKGTLVSFFFAASGFEPKVNLLDVSKASYGYSKLATRQPQNADPTKIRFNAASSGETYPITVTDPTRQGWWAAIPNSAQYTLFISKTGEITQYPALGGSLSNAALVLCGSLNLLIAVDGGYEAGKYAGTGYRSLHIRDVNTGVVTKSLTLGTVPSLVDGYDGGTLNFHRADVMGLQWCEQLRCIVGYDQSTTPPRIVKLSPPATGNPAVEPWTWGVIPVAHSSQDVGGQATLQSAVSNIWSKFRFIPTLGAFVVGTARDRRPQVIRLF